MKQAMHNIYASCTAKLNKLFFASRIDEKLLDELERLLIEADTGTTTTQKIMSVVKDSYKAQPMMHGKELKKLLAQELYAKLIPYKKSQHSRNVYLLVGVNGSGKTTFAGRFAVQQSLSGKKVLLVAGDTFRAAACEQLKEWAHKGSISIVLGKNGEDPGSVIFKGCSAFAHEQYDTLIIDTAGRLQTRVNLMQELAKIRRIIEKNTFECNVSVLLTIDAMLGQNSFDQARLFNECIAIDGIVLTKMDGTGRGGIVFSINNELQIPIAHCSSGETLASLQEFDAKWYVNALLGDEK